MKITKLGDSVWLQEGRIYRRFIEKVCDYTLHTWPDAACASARRDTDNHTCKHIWWAAIANGPRRAAIDVLKVIVKTAARVLPRRKPPKEKILVCEWSMHKELDTVIYIESGKNKCAHSPFDKW